MKINLKTAMNVSMRRTKSRIKQHENRLAFIRQRESAVADSLNSGKFSSKALMEQLELRIQYQEVIHKYIDKMVNFTKLKKFINRKLKV